MSPLTFAAKYLGQRVTAPGGLGGECVDLINLWLDYAYHLPPVRANAADWRNDTIPGSIWVVNGPMNFPAAGSIVVWGESAEAGTGPNGHIALALYGDPLHFLSCDQNWPEGAPVSLRLHTYAGVKGWFRRGSG
jgi:hypothetical protein